MNATSLLEMTHAWFIRISLCTCMEHVCWRHQAVCMTIRDMFNGYFTSAVLVIKLWWSETGFMNSLSSASRDLHVKTPGETEWSEVTGGWISGGSRIFQSRGANIRKDTNLLFAIIFAENCMKMNKLDWEGDACPSCPLDPPLRKSLILGKLKFTWS